MAAVRSALCSLRAGFPVRPMAGGLTIPVRGAQYSPMYVQPVGTERDQLKAVLNTPEVSEIMYRPVKAAISDVSNSIFYHPLLLKFTNLLMRKGDKSHATLLIHRALYEIKLMRNKNGLNPLETLEQAIQNASPVLETSKVKRGGITYAVPVPMTERRSQFIAMKWILEAADDKERHVRFYDQLAKELVDAANNTGRVIKRKQESHKTAEANKAYAHYRYA